MPVAKGYKQTPEHAARRAAHRIDKPLPEAVRAKLRKPKPLGFAEMVRRHARLRRPVSDETRRLMSEAHLGYKPGPDTRHKLSEIGKARARAGLHHFWKGGVTPENQRIRQTGAYRAWRTAVFERDNYTCTSCGERGVKLQADHIKPFAYFPEFRFSVENGRTLCVPCHKQTESYAGRGRQYYERSLAA